MPIFSVLAKPKYLLPLPKKNQFHKSSILPADPQPSFRRFNLVVISDMVLNKMKRTTGSAELHQNVTGLSIKDPGFGMQSRLSSYQTIQQNQF
jgi:hypothetical protein